MDKCVSRLYDYLSINYLIATYYPPTFLYVFTLPCLALTLVNNFAVYGRGIKNPCDMYYRKDILG